MGSSSRIGRRIGISMSGSSSIIDNCVSRISITIVDSSDSSSRMYHFYHSEEEC